jgi:hypothetical protein
MPTTETMSERNLPPMRSQNDPQTPDRLGGGTTLNGGGGEGTINYPPYVPRLLSLPCSLGVILR